MFDEQSDFETHHIDNQIVISSRESKGILAM